MPSIFAIIKKSGVGVSPCQRHVLDVEDFFPNAGGDQNQGESTFEYPRPDRPIITLKPLGPDSGPSIFRYFIDGSRRIQKVAEIVVGGRFYPMLAGQVGVAVTFRDPDSNKLSPLRDYCDFPRVIALPDRLGDEIATIQKKLDSMLSLPFRVLAYDTSHIDRNPNDLAASRIMREMLDLEVDMVERLALSGRLSPSNLLVRDGPLQIRRTKATPIVFEHAIGVSKTFSTNAPVKTGSRPLDVGSLVTDLNLFDRTKCYKLDMVDKSIAFWYVRLHRKEQVPNPALDGVVKIEKIVQSYEHDQDGLDRDVLDTISRHLFEERNVTPYGSDSRWANHIYPIYLTERFLKSSLDSNIKFSGYFRE